MAAETEIRTYHTGARQGKEVEVILEFPPESEERARKELFRGLKAIYLERTKGETGQESNPKSDMKPDPESDLEPDAEPDPVPVLGTQSPGESEFDPSVSMSGDRGGDEVV